MGYSNLQHCIDIGFTVGGRHLGMTFVLCSQLVVGGHMAGWMRDLFLHTFETLAASSVCVKCCSVRVLHWEGIRGASWLDAECLLFGSVGFPPAHCL